jgi:transposase
MSPRIFFMSLFPLELSVLDLFFTLMSWLWSINMPQREGRLLAIMFVRTIYSERDKPGAIKHECRKESTHSQFLTEAKYRVLKDVVTEELRLVKLARADDSQVSNVREQAKKTIADYYCVTVRAIEKWAKADKEGSLSPKPRAGRPKKITSPVKRQICAAFNGDKGRSLRGTRTALKKQKLISTGGSAYQTTYTSRLKGTTSVSTAPSLTSVHRVIKEGRKLSIKKRPKLNKENKRIRYDFAKAEMKKTDEERSDNIVAIDDNSPRRSLRFTVSASKSPRSETMAASSCWMPTHP